MHIFVKKSLFKLILKQNISKYCLRNNFFLRYKSFKSCSHILVQIGEGNKFFQNLFQNLFFSNTYRQDTFRKIPNYNQSLVDKLKWRKSLFDLFFKGNILKYCLGNIFFQRYKVSLFIYLFSKPFLFKYLSARYVS